MSRFSKILFLICFLQGSFLFAQNDTLTYGFFGHPYRWGDATKIDVRIENMDTSQFDGIWLGGDVLSEASLLYSNFEYLDGLFDLSKPSNHWALGNHDIRNRNIEWYKEFTKRESYYAHSTKGLTTLVLNGNLSPLNCEDLDKQFEIIKTVCDTISEGFLVILVHHGIYSNVPGVDEPTSYGHSRLENWMANCYDDSASYLNAIYPMLVEVEQRGVQVMHIMGDVGANKKFYYGESADGIEFFGSGINNSYNELKNIPITDPDLILVLKHIPKENKMIWSFVELNSIK